MKIIRRSVYVITVCVVIFLLCFSATKAMEEIMPYGNLDSISEDDMFKKTNHFFVYFYKEQCKFCDNIKEDIKKLGEKNLVYANNTERMDGIYDYDWIEHEKLYDVEIGIQKNDRIELYGNRTKEMIKNEFPPLEYDIVMVDQDYAALHNKLENHIYAISTHPVLDQSDFDKKLTIPGVPLLLEFDEGKVINYFFDDKEIINYLKSETKPINEYWNIGG